MTAAHAGELFLLQGQVSPGMSVSMPLSYGAALETRNRFFNPSRLRFKVKAACFSLVLNGAKNGARHADIKARTG